MIDEDQPTPELVEVARVMLDGDALSTRAMVQAYLEGTERLDLVASPSTSRPEVLVASAALLELLSVRRGHRPPAWTRAVGGLEQPRYLVKAAATMERLRKLCDEESPTPLRSRGLLAPPDYLTFA